MDPHTDPLFENIFHIHDEPSLKDIHLFEKLSHEINDLLRNNFERLVYILYRIDVSEEKLKILLKENPTEDAGKIIARLIIERQLEKARVRQEFSKRNTDNSGEEKWQ